MVPGAKSMVRPGPEHSCCEEQLQPQRQNLDQALPLNFLLLFFPSLLEHTQLLLFFCKRIAGDENLNRQLILLERFFSNHSPHSRTNRIADSSLFKSNIELSQAVRYSSIKKARDKQMSISGSAFGELREPLKSELLSCFKSFSLIAFIKRKFGKGIVALWR